MFGGEVFESIVDKASDIFDTLPPPTPSLMVNNNYGIGAYGGLGQAPTPQPQTPIVMSYYNDPGGGCFDSNCKITMADGNIKKLKDLQKDDLIMSYTRNNEITSAKVVCIFETKITMGIHEYVDLDNGLYVTPWHPIKYNGEWVFPANIKVPIMKKSESMITLVLDNHHIACINGYQCIMLGHNFTDNDVLKHPFYGTNKVIDILKYQYGWETGHILVKDFEIEYTKDDNNLTNMTYFKNIRSEPQLLAV
jgi:hypothetical protein